MFSREIDHRGREIDHRGREIDHWGGEIDHWAREIDHRGREIGWEMWVPGEMWGRKVYPGRVLTGQPGRKVYPGRVRLPGSGYYPSRSEKVIKG